MMRIRLIACLIALLGIASSAQAQDNLLPPCSHAQLGTLAEIRPAYEALIKAAPSMFKRDSFLPYIEAYFGWREGLRSQTPLCAEIFEIALLMERNASNFVASPAISTVLFNADRSPTDNPYLEERSGDGSIPDELARQIELAEARANDTARASPDERPLRACTDADYDSFYAVVFDPYIELVQTMTRSRIVRNLLLIVESVLDWRVQVWRGLPACEGMHEITWLITQATSDFSVYGTFDLAKMAPEADRFEAAVAQTSATVAEKTPAFLGKASPDAQTPESALPGCARSQVDDLTPIILEYIELTQATEDIASIDDVFAFGQRQYEWREERLANLPACAEVFELGLLIDQATGDIVLVMALLLAGVDANGIPHMEAIQAGSARMSALVTPILQGERAGADALIPRPLPQCTASQLASITTEIERDFWAFVDASAAVETIEDLLHVGEMQIAFRESIWSRLPACAEVYDIAWLMYRVTADDVITWALTAAGADEEDISHSASTRAGLGRLNAMLAEIADATADAED